MLHPVVMISFLAICLLGLPIGSVSQSEGAVPVSRLQLPLNATGPDSTAFNQEGRGPFTGIADGRIIEYVNSSVGFVYFADTSDGRPDIICAGSINPAPICGKPLGLSFNQKTGELYVAHSARGLIVVSSDGGNATVLASSAGGVPFRFLNGLDIDQDSEVVYFTDTSTKFSLSEILAVILTRDRTGRLLSYNPRTKEVRVLLEGLAGANGVALSSNSNFLIFTELVTSTLQRFWLKGPKANTTELVAKVEGIVDGIRRKSRGEFWVATTVTAVPFPVPIGLRISEEGVLLQNVTFDIKPVGLLLSEVNEFGGQLYLGLTTQRFLGRTNL